MKFLSAFLFSAVAIATGSSSLFAQSANERLCYELAGSPADQRLPEGLPGVAFSQVSSEAAIEACAAAWVQEGIRDPYLAYTLGRAYHSGDQFKEAEAMYNVASQMGVSLASNNYGVLFEEGLGVEQDTVRAYELFALSGDQGLQLGHSNAVKLIEEGHLGEPNWTNAAIHWRALMQGGDTEAAFKLATKIAAGDIQSSHSGELEAAYKRSSRGGHFQAARDYSKWLENTQNNEFASLEAAYTAYDITANADLSSEEGWLVYEQQAAKRIIDLIDENGLAARDVTELAMFRRDFAPDSMKSYNVPIACGEETDVEFKVYIWDWSRDLPQTTEQATWIEQARGCEFPDDVVASFERLFLISKEQSTSFVAITEYAFSNETEEPTSTPSQPDYQRHVDYNLGSKIATDLRTSFTVSLVCNGDTYTRTYSVYFGSGFVAGDNFTDQVGSAALRLTPCSDEPENASWANDTLQRLVAYNDRVNDSGKPLYATLSLFNAVTMTEADDIPFLFVAECTQAIENFFLNPDNEMDTKVSMSVSKVESVEALIAHYQDEISDTAGLLADQFETFRKYAKNPIEKAALRRSILLASSYLMECADQEEVGSIDALGYQAQIAGFTVGFIDRLVEHIRESTASQRKSFRDWVAFDFGFYHLTISGDARSHIMVLCNEMASVDEKQLVLIEDANPGVQHVIIDGTRFELNHAYSRPVAVEDQEMVPLVASDLDGLLAALKRANSIEAIFTDGTKSRFSASGSSKAINWVMGRCDI